VVKLLLKHHSVNAHSKDCRFPKSTDSYKNELTPDPAVIAINGSLNPEDAYTLKHAPSIIPESQASDFVLASVFVESFFAPMSYLEAK
jgi:hypothetical protein